MKYVYALLAVLILAITALTLNPGLITFGDFNLALTYPVGQMIAMRGIVALVLGVLFIVTFIIALIRFFAFRQGLVMGIVSIGFLVVAAAHYFVLSGRGLDANEALAPDHGVTHVSQGNGDITVLSYNTLGGQTSMSDLEPIITGNGVDIVVLSETSEQNAQILADALASRGLAFTVFSSGADQYRPEIESTTVLVSGSLGEYRQSPTFDLTYGSVNLRSLEGGPDIIGVHPVAPVKNLQDVWRDEITEVYSVCTSMENTIMAGDFNSTIDHMIATGADCTSALDGANAGVGTWPASVPGIFGSPIDNVYTDWNATNSAIVQVGDSDHRGVLVRLSN